MTDMDTWNILIVDDEKEITDLLEVYLSSEGYRVFKFYCGQDALDCIEREHIDLAILDVMLPDVDGFTLCRKILCRADKRRIWLGQQHGRAQPRHDPCSCASSDRGSALPENGTGADGLYSWCECNRLQLCDRRGNKKLSESA